VIGWWGGEKDELVISCWELDEDARDWLVGR